MSPGPVVADVGQHTVASQINLPQRLLSDPGSCLKSVARPHAVVSWVLAHLVPHGSDRSSLMSNGAHLVHRAVTIRDSLHPQ